ncbi:MAG TPA: DUF1127 domain-containing protein [Beijerinckiaceae bacterium]|jgi:uncharacterized protein YjiS (DUF1127 family)
MSSHARADASALLPLNETRSTSSAPRRTNWLRSLAAAWTVFRSVRASRRELTGLDDRLLRDVGLVRLRDASGRVAFARSDEYGLDR